MRLAPPDHLAPGLAPGGIVVHVYNVAGVLLLERRLAAAAGYGAAAVGAVDAAAVANRLAAAGELGAVVLVYDGDTGRPLEPPPPLELEPHLRDDR